jgi:hypothetical protein
MTKFFHSIIFIAALFLVTGCEKVIDPGDLPDQEIRVVVNSVASAENPISAQVSLSRSILDNKPYPMLSGAQCELYENGEFAEIMPEHAAGFYGSTFNARQGAHYTLRVRAPGHEVVEGTTGIPSPVVIKSVVRVDSLSSRITRFSFPGAMNFSYSGSVKLQIKLSDNPGETNYYGLKPVVTVFDSAGVEIEDIEAYITIPDDAGFSAENTYFDDNGIAFTDNFSANGEIVADVEIYFSGPTASFPTKVAQTYRISLELFSFSEDLYKYNTSHYLQRTSGSGFFAEPVLVHSNMSNGMGIFGGLNSRIEAVNSGSIMSQ